MLRFLILLFIFFCSISYGQESLAPEQQIKFLAESGDSAFNAQNYELAINYSAEALKLAEKLSNKELQIKPLGTLAGVHFDLKDLPTARKYYMKSLELGEELNKPKTVIFALNGLAGIHSLQGKHKEALTYYNRALKLADEINSSQRIGVLMNKGQSLIELELYEEALSIILTGVEHFKEKKDTTNLALLYNNIGELYRDNLKNYDLARKHYKMAIDLNSKSGNLYQLAQNYNNYGLLFSHDAYDIPDSAIYFLEKSLELRIQLGDEGGELVASYNLGEALANHGSLEKSKPYFDRTLHLATEREVYPGIYFAHMGLAKIARAENNEEALLENLKAALSTAEMMDNAEMILQVNDELYTFYAEKQQFKDANLYLKRINSILDSLYLLSQSESIGPVQARYEKELSEAENRILRSQQKENKALLEAKRTETLIWILSSIALGIIIMLLIYAFYQRSLALKKEKENREELRLQLKVLERQELELKELNQIKNRIFSILGHDLRAPLNTISSFIELLQTGDLPREDYEEILKNLKAETHHTLKTLENILAWARMQMNEKSVEFEDVNIQELMMEIQMMFKPIADVKDIDLILENHQNVVVKGSEVQLRSIVTNLVSNAIKFSPREKNIYMELRSLNEEAEIIIRDEGVGFDEETLKNFNEGRAQKSSYGTQGESGTGIGLTLVKEFVQNHGGTIKFEHNHPQGTMARILLPIRT